MKRIPQVGLAVLSVAGAVALTGCVVVPAHHRGGEVAYVPAPVVVVDTPPPAPYVEVVPTMPYAGGVWIGGYWGWSGGRHQWVPGHWDHGRPGYRWEPHRWERADGHWHLRGGAWVRL